MKPKRKSKYSTLHLPLKGSTLGDGRIKSVEYAPKSRVTRDVVLNDGSQKRVSKVLLQDRLLIRKGYLPKYSGKDLEWFKKQDNSK